jgi:hypothetical protein
MSSVGNESGRVVEAAVNLSSVFPSSLSVLPTSVKILGKFIKRRKYGNLASVN